MLFRLLCGVSVLIAVVLAAGGCQAQPLSLEEQAWEIDRSLMCPVCPGESIDQSQAELAKQMRAIVLEKLQAGQSRQEILDFFVARYGERVLAAPTKSGLNLLAWVVPGAGLIAGAIILLVVLRNMRRVPEPATAVGPSRSVTEEELAPYLGLVDEEMRQALADGPHDTEAGRKRT